VPFPASSFMTDKDKLQYILPIHQMKPFLFSLYEISTSFR